MKIFLNTYGGIYYPLKLVTFIPIIKRITTIFFLCALRVLRAFTITAFAETTALSTSFLLWNENSLIDVRDYNLFIFIILVPSTKCLIKCLLKE